MKKTILLTLSLLSFFTVLGCDDLKDTKSNQFEGGDSDIWEYPLNLVIGGGLSETLSVLRIEEDLGFIVLNDVAPLGSGINQTIRHKENFYAVCSLSNSIVVYDDDLTVLREISVGVGTNPMTMDFADGQKAWISGLIADDVRLIDLSAQADEWILATVPMPAGDQLPRDAGVKQNWARPNGLVVRGDRVFVALGNLQDTYTPAGPGLLAVIDAETRELSDLIELEGRGPIGMSWDEERGWVWVMSPGNYQAGEGFTGNGMIEAIDPESLEIMCRIEIDGSPFEMLIDGERGYLGNGRDGRLLVVDLEEGDQLASIDLRRHPDQSGLSFVSGLALDTEGYLYAVEFNSDRLYVIDTANDYEIVGDMIVNDGPDTLTFIP